MKRGFTLIEMVVVLVVMAVAAHLAVRELSRLRERQLAETAERQLGEFRDAVWSHDADGAPTGFLSDMGRPPRSLDELWSKPDDAGRYVVTNIGGGVYVPTGWNGPYLRLPAGKTAVFDPWGNDFRCVTNAQGFATNVFHMGSAGQERTRSAGLSLAPDGWNATALVVVLEDGDAASLSLYGPDGFGGVTNYTATVAGSTARFGAISPGVRVLTWGGGASRIVYVKPGDNIIPLRPAK